MIPRAKTRVVDFALSLGPRGEALRQVLVLRLASLDPIDNNNSI